MGNLLEIRNLSVDFRTPGGRVHALRNNDIDVPEPAAGEVRLSISAIGLNRADALLRQNQYTETPVLPSKH